MIAELLNYCGSCEEEFNEDDYSHSRFYDSEICYGCAEAQWEHYNDRQSEYWA